MSSDGQERHPLVRRLRQGAGLPVAVGVTLVALAAGGEEVASALRYDRTAIAGGEAWRLLTGHLVHASLTHLGLNVAGLILLSTLFGADYRGRDWVLVGFASALATGLGLWLLRPDLGWYVGFSGILHGVLAAGAVAWWRGPSKGLALLLSLLLIGKLAWEQLHGALGWSGDLEVIVDAHLFGAAGGLLAALAILLTGRPPGGIPPSARGPV